MLRIGLLGAGRIGKVHAKAITSHPLSQLVAVSDINTEAAAQLATQYGAQPLSNEAIIADASIDAVLVATSTNTHSELIEAATKAGKAVLCEKPVDLSLARAQACLRATAPNGRPVMIGFNRRFDPNFAALKAAVDRGEIGKSELLSITSFDPAPPPVSYVKVSGGLFRDMMIHDFDMALWIMGATPEKVTAIGSSIVDPEIGAAGDVDTAAVTLRTKAGVLCQIVNSRRATYGYDQRIEAHGSAGMLRAGNMTATTVEHANGQGFTTDPALPFFLERYAAAYRAELDAFIAAVTENAPAYPDGEDGLKALLFADAAETSHRTGQVVKI